MIMMWLENHLILLGLLAVLVGLGLGALLSATQWNADGAELSTRRRPAGRARVRRTTIS